MDTYEIVRFRFRGDQKVLLTGLDLVEAQEHCNDPQTSSKTATVTGGGCSCHGVMPNGTGEWFDGYREE